jgi:DNA-binding LacI/PurR family transcriptional regulator
VPFDAVFGVTDMIALGAMSALAEHGLRVPQDVQVVGFDNLLFTDFLDPRLTSVDPHSRELAATAMRLLEQRMSGADAAPEHVVNPVSLVVRGSTRAG